METSEQKNEWYQKKWLVTLLCIVFFPIGLYALWKNTIIKKGWKIAITAFFALVVIANLSNKNSGGNNVQPEQNTSSTPVVVTPPQQTAPDIQILQKRIKWNPDVQGAVTIDCVVRNNSNDLKDYVELDASFFDKGGKILGTG
ncbi:MAG TPA: hypothetical protein VNG53_06260, partial [Bacteroidia bacterium]|nr:hypothetical protein [Bacteroidia bacterium]